MTMTFGVFNHFIPVLVIGAFQLAIGSRAVPGQCIDKFEIMQNHTMCIANPSQRLNETDRHEIETVHNTIRGNVTPPASVMMEIGYALALEREAQTWADTCSFTHDDPYYRFQPGRYHVGQNIYISDKNMSWTDVIGVWESENSSFSFNNSLNDPNKVSNYTQLVWKDSQLIGCGMKDCGSKVFYVCNYAPGLVQSRMNTPYTKGSTNGDGCQKQFSNTTHSLCSCVGKFCVNGGTLNMNTCNCECVQGVKDYDDHICELNCTAGGDHADCSTMNITNCRTDLMAPFKCPWKCKVCPYGGKYYRENSVRMPWDTTTTSTTTLAMPSATGNSTTMGNQPRGSGNNHGNSVAYSLFLLGCSFFFAMKVLYI